MTAANPNIIHTGEPSNSALRVAKLRAVHQLLDEPIIFNDPYALPILGPKIEAEIREDPFQYNDPLSRGLRASLVARCMVAEDELHKAVQAGAKQYVVLGAGLDTFALRNADENVQVFEVDHPSTQEWKKSLLQDAGISRPQSLTHVALDFEKQSLADGLREAGFRADQPAYFSWLGVTYYLTKDAIFETLRFVASLSKGSAITFDYGVSRTMLNPIERVISEYLAKVIAEQGEPWISFFDPITFRDEVQKLGFRSVENFSPDDLNRRYFFRRKDGLRVGGGSRWMCAKT